MVDFVLKQRARSPSAPSGTPRRGRLRAQDQVARTHDDIGEFRNAEHPSSLFCSLRWRRSRVADDDQLFRILTTERSTVASCRLMPTWFAPADPGAAYIVSIMCARFSPVRRRKPPPAKSPS